MNELQRNQEVERALNAWMDGAAPTQVPSRLLEGTFAETMRSKQARTYVWDRIALDRPSGFLGAPLARGLIVVALLAALALALALAGGGSGPTVAPSGAATPSLPPTLPPIPSVPIPTVLLPAPVSITSDTSLTVPDLVGFEMDGTQLWGLVPGRIDRIELATGRVTGTVSIGSPTDLFNGIARNDDGLWATDWDNATLYRVDEVTFREVAAIPAGLAPKGVLANADGVWVADTHDGKVLRVDPATNTVIARISVGPTGNNGPNWLASGLASIWVDIPNDRSIVRVDTVTDAVQARLASPDLMTACGGLAIGTNAVWVSGCDASAALGRLDPVTNTPVLAVELPGHGGPTLIDDKPWVSVDTGGPTGGYLVRIDPATNTIDRVLMPDSPFGGGGGIVVVAGSVWVHDGYNRVLFRFPLAAFRA